MSNARNIASGAKFVDASGDTMSGNLTTTGSIGVGTTSPSSLIDIHVNSSTAYSATAEPREDAIIHNINGADGSGVNNHATLGFHVANGATSQGFLNYVRTADNTGAFTVSQRTGSSSYAEHLKIDSSGNVTTPNNPWFDVRGSGSVWTSALAGDNILNIFSTSLYQNTGGGFNSSNSTYTAPVAGRYCFLLNSYTKGGSTGAANSYIYPRLFKNGSSIRPRSNILHYNANENHDLGVENTILVDLAANDTIQAGFNSNNTSNQYYGAVWHLQMFFVG